MQVITYSLRDNEQRSDQYYRDVAACADKVQAEGELRFSSLVLAFQSFLGESAREEPRSRPEYYYELLTLGVLWRVYAHDALELGALPRHVLTQLAQVREQVTRLKPVADAARDLFGAWLVSEGGPSHSAPLMTTENLVKLLGWLAATGSFREEVKRLTGWREFIGRLPTEQAAAYLADILVFAAWFEAYSDQVLGRYTHHVEEFLRDAGKRYRWRADRILCRRTRVEYHLSMVGTETLNRAFRAEFLHTPHKAVLLPPCMRYQGEDRCQAKATELGACCAHCSPQCRVHQITLLGEKHGFQVLILPDELSVFSAQGAGDQRQASTGVVGVSCVLTNAPGGWETRDMGVPAQGLPLDYCGCRWHWHKEGIPTDVNVLQLLRVMEIQ